MSSAAAAAARLEALSVAAFVDAMDGRDVVLGGIGACLPVATVAWPAYTVRLGAGDNLGLHLALADAPPGPMLVAVCPEPPEHGIWPVSAGRPSRPATSSAGTRTVSS